MDIQKIKNIFRKIFRVIPTWINTCTMKHFLKKLKKLLLNFPYCKSSILFVVKQGKLDYIDEDSSPQKPKSSGLFNSARLVVEMLRHEGVEANLEVAVDNNDIDRLVTKYRPRIVVIEALWVVPEKFQILKKRHPRVKWIVRLHSEFPFLSMEGMAMEWIFGYVREGVILAANSERILHDLEKLTKKKVLFAPNYYPVNFDYCHNNPVERNYVHVGCFGAVRPYKNQLLQAVAAIRFAESNDLRLLFHMNTTRIENQGSPILKNIRHLFKNMPRHSLIEHRWLDHSQFIDLVRQMDYGMQVSFTETFNIVTADLVNANIPVVVSNEVEWASSFYKAKNPSDVNEISDKLQFAKDRKASEFHYRNKSELDKYSKKARNTWLSLICTFYKR